jgi:putative peptide zinc metalloprotease protein
VSCSLPSLSPASLSVRGATVAHMVKNRATGGRFQLGPREFFVLSRLDGRRSLGEIGAEYAATFQRRLGDAAWGQLLGLLAVRHLLAGGVAPPAPEKTKKGVQRLGLTRGRYVLGDPSAFIARLYRRVGWLYRPVVLVPLLLMAAGMDVYLAGHLSTLWAGVRATAHQPPLLMLGGILLWAGAAGHELAHGLTCRHYGGDASAVGVRWSGPVIAAFCTVDDVYLFPSRRARAATAASGVIANHVFLLPFFALWLALPAADVTRAAIGAVLLFGLGQALFNYLPVPPLDGYHVVAHLLNVTDLADESRQYLRLRLAARLGRGPVPAGYPRRVRPVYLAYGVFVSLTSIKPRKKGVPA